MNGSGRKPTASHQSIETKASFARPDDPSSVRALVEEVFNFPRAYPRFADLLEAGIKNRLSEAETSYLRQGTPVVREEDVVRLMNDMAARFQAPAYVQTSARQVRALRLGLALVEPRFMGRGIARQDTRVGERISSEMSPLQAVNLLATLVDQKIVNPDYQVSPAEWDRTFDVGSMKKLDDLRRAAAEAGLQALPGTAVLMTRGDSKRKLMEEFLAEKASSLTWSESWILVDELFNAFGIK